MIRYSFSYQKPHRHFIDIEVSFEVKRNTNNILAQLPSWRPGRYELGNFSKNIQKFIVIDQYNNKIDFKKITKDCWSIDIDWQKQDKDSKKITIKYNYYSNILDAGSSYLDKNQLYVNPVNCCLYIVGMEQEKCQIYLDIPKTYKIACGLKQTKENTLIANNFDQLAESPFIASSSLKHFKYLSNDITFHLWFQGLQDAKINTVLNDFKAFTDEQIKNFNSFPTDDYHFLFQLTPYNSYHGVEHTNSTVILLGSEENVLQKRYEDMLGICSHELYHTWNIKSIRPKEMYPYDYTKENYSNLGYVAEGVTTYMGDLMLIRSKVFTWEQFAKTQNGNLRKHYENDGRFNLSLSSSGFDTWLDGYSLGIPNRKTSIYTEGALNMLMIDLSIINYSNSKHSLHTVMNDLYQNFALNSKGYSENDFINLCVKYGGQEVKTIIDNHIYQNLDYTNSLSKTLKYVGIDLVKINNPNLAARYFGFIYSQEKNKIIVKKIQNNFTDNLNDQNKIYSALAVIF